MNSDDWNVARYCPRKLWYLPGVRKAQELTNTGALFIPLTLHLHVLIHSAELLELNQPMEDLMLLIRAAKEHHEHDSRMRERVETFCENYAEWRDALIIQNPAEAIPKAVDIIGNDVVLAVPVVKGDRDLGRLRKFYGAFCSLWRTDCQDRLHSQVVASIKWNELKSAVGSESQAPLDLAVMIFTCQDSPHCMHSSSALRWPAVLSHRCARDWNYADHKDCGSRISETQTMPGLLTSIAGEYMNCGPWDPKGLILGEHFDRAIKVVLGCGLDPMHATVEEMDLLRVRLYCDRCEADPKVGGVHRIVMNWRDAVSHVSIFCAFNL